MFVNAALQVGPGEPFERCGSMSISGKAPPPFLSRPPPAASSRLTCFELVEVASLEHYVLKLDRRCRLVFARRTCAAFETMQQIRECFHAIEFKLADVPREHYQLLVDARMGPGRNDKVFELVLEEERGKLLCGFARNAALATSAAGRLQIQRFAKQDGCAVLATDEPAQAFDYLGLRPHVL
jgi:hypothetical protein